MLFDEEMMLFGVADGVGGLPGGAEAAQAVVDVVTTGVREWPRATRLDLAKIVTHANEAVVSLGIRISPGLGIGSTVTLGCVRASKLKLAHVGDSRAFAIRDGELAGLTEDHSVENEAIRRRAKGEVVYYSESQRGALTRCIGQLLAPEVDLSEVALVAGDRFLFCTDGVTRLVSEADLLRLAGTGEDPRAIARSIVDLAVHRGGPDNASVVFVIVDTP